jgi:hypothetical protein
MANINIEAKGGIVTLVGEEHQGLRDLKELGI